MLTQKRDLTEEEYKDICCNVTSFFGCESCGYDYASKKIIWVGFNDQDKEYITDYSLYDSWKDMYFDIVEEDINCDLYDYTFDNYVLDRQVLEDLGFEEKDYE